MESSASVFKRGWEILWEQPGAYLVVAILPHMGLWALVILIGRLVVRAVQSYAPIVDPLTLWASMGWGMRLLIILAIVAMATVPTYVVARGVSRLALERQRNIDISLGAVLVDMVRFFPTAVLYFLVLAIATFLGSSLLVVPGLLLASACALIIPAAIDGQLGPLAAIRRGISLVGRVFGRVLGVYASFLALVIAGRVVLSIFTAGDEAPGFSFFVLLGFWFLTLLWTLLANSRSIVQSVNSGPGASFCPDTHGRGVAGQDPRLLTSRYQSVQLPRSLFLDREAKTPNGPTPVTSCARSSKTSF